MTEPQETGDPPSTERTSPGLVSAIQNLTDGVTTLVRDQIALVRLEFKREATHAGGRGLGLLAGAAVALIGYVFLLQGAILAAGWMWGLGAMGAVAAAVGLLHVVGGVTLARRYRRELEQQSERIEQRARNALETTSWPDQNPDN